MSDLVLNPPGAGPAATHTDAVELSRELLHAARELGAEPRADARARLQRAANALRAVDPRAALAHDDRRFAFWLNVYNALVRDALDREGARGNLLLKVGLFARSAYLVGHERFSLDVIEHGLLRHNRRPPTSVFRVLKPGDPRLACAPARFDPRIHFALNCGARSCPPIRSYEPDRLDEQLDTATRAYFEAEARVDPAARTVSLPRLCKYYAADFGSRVDVVRFAARHLPSPDGAWLEQNAATVRVRYSDYDWSIEA